MAYSTTPLGNYKTKLGGEAVSSVGKVLVCEYEDLSSILQLGVMMCIYQPRPGR